MIFDPIFEKEFYMTDIQAFKQGLKSEAENNIFGFWLKMRDKHNGGFHCLTDFEGNIQENSNKAVLLHSRILWSFSAAYRVLDNLEYLEAAKECFDFLIGNALDNEFGGVYWMLDHQGQVIDTQKHVYNQGFAIYAFCEYFLASGDERALKHAKGLYELIETHAFDEEFGGYLEAFDRQWNSIPNHLVCDTSEDVLAEKSMNTHLHIMEAYTTLHKAEPNTGVQAKLKALIELTRDHIIDSNYHYGLFFTRDWQCVSRAVSYGHDIEGTWLMDEAAGQLEDPILSAEILVLTTKMAQVTLAEGLDRDGAVLNELLDGHLIDSDRIWWVQAEAMVGFFNAFQKDPQMTFYEQAQNCWHIIQTQIIDKNHGEWHWKVDRLGRPYDQESKVEPWKCPYHNGRACLEVYSRIVRLEAENLPTIQP